jgi:Arc/MetJ-type ribon-helix-helix transcriptional regulator
VAITLERDCTRSGHFGAMAKVEKLNLNRDLTAEVRAAVAGGEHRGVSEVVRGAPRYRRLRRETETLETEEPRCIVREATDRGPALVADAVFARPRARFAQPPGGWRAPPAD